MGNLKEFLYKRLINIPIILIILNLISILNANEIIGCGGFIKSNTDINYKIIQVKLFTKDKILKYTTESSSVNGYYMIPVYNKGEYILKVEPPPGWSFDPNEIALNIDGVNDPCSKNEDLNFFFKGFGLSGKVITYGDVNRKGPANIKLDLLSNNEIIGSTTSANDGSYYFSNVMPGNYYVQASHPKWKFKVNKISVTLSKDNWSAKEYISVSGYTIEGYVLSADKKPLPNAIVTLKFNGANLGNLDTSKYECERDEKIIDSDEICYVRTNDKGKYEFNNIGFQKYKLQAVYKLDNSIIIYTKPDTINVDLLKHDNAVVNEKFELNYLNLKSKAVIVDNAQNNNEVSFDNAQLLMNDKEVAGEKTSNLGEFRLNNLVHGTQYKFTLKAMHVYFEEKTLTLDLGLKSISDSLKDIKNLAKFFVKSFDVCGRIKFKQEIKSSDLARLAKIIRLKVYQTLANQNEEINVRYVNIDENLNYCFKLNKSPIDYVIKIDILNTNSDRDADLETYLKFISDEKRININKEPVLDLNFEQFDAELNGIVEFIGDCPADFTLNLKSTNRASFVKQITNLKCDPSKKQIEFNIKNILYGQYYLISNYDNVFCWSLSTSNVKNSNELILNINKDKETINLKQVAFKLAYTFHDLNINFKLTNSKNELILQKKLSSQSDLTGSICINQINENLNLDIDSCHLIKPASEYAEQVQEISLNKFSINLNSLFNLKQIRNKIEFVSTKHTVSIEISANLDKNVNENELNNDYKEIELHIYEVSLGATSASEEEIIKDREPNEKILLTNPKIKRVDNGLQLIFSSTNWLSAEKVYLFKPISKKYLFKPTFTKYKLDSVNCNANMIKFNAKLGLFIRGIITPNKIEGFEVNLKSFDNQTTYFSEMTDAQQGFYFGPFESEQNEDLLDKYRVEVTKPGYLFKLVSKKFHNGEYVLEYFGDKLGELRIIVQETEKLIFPENVLVSLSSSNKLYRKIIKTNASGHALFENLEADVYYLLIMMQEYEFKPSSEVINITSGYKVSFIVEAKRVAYSCYGKINTINGLPIGDVIVEAHGHDDIDNLNCKLSQENTKSDNETGLYRIRGLKPECKYEITIKQEKNDGYKIIPDNYNIEVNRTDISDVNFVLIDNTALTTEIALKTNLVSSKSASYKATTAQKTFKNNIRLKLYKLAQPDSILQTFVIPSNTVFYLPRLARDNQHYLLQIELLTPTATVSAMSAQQQQQQQSQQVAVLDRDEIVFQTDKLFRQLVVDFDLDVKKHSSFGASGSYFDPYGQQYQTIYFTLPLFLMILTIVYFKYKDLIEFIKLIRQKLENHGYLNSVVGNNLTTAKSNTQKVNQKTQKQQQQQQQQQTKVQTSDKSSNELDSSSSSSIDVIDTDDIATATVTNVTKKTRLRKA